MDEVTASQWVIPDFQALTIGMVVFFLGALLTRRIAFLRNFNIPEPVAGGLSVALITWAIYGFFHIEISFTLDTRDELLVVFFTTIGLNARLSDLVSGGRLLGILLAVTLGFIIVQDIVGLAGALAFGLPADVGVLLGSASLIGGHGTAIAWGPTIAEKTGFAAASEVGIAAATLGLVVASFLGGPLAKLLIERNRLTPETEAVSAELVGIGYEDRPEHRAVNHVSLIRALLVTNIAIMLGYGLDGLIARTGVKLPAFVSCLLVAIFLSNTVPRLMPKLEWPARTKALALISDYSLSIFLAMSLMSMQLWTLAGLGGPLIAVLMLQVVITALFILLVFFRLAGRDYTAAVLSAGVAGFTLGATPTAIANMSSVTKHYGPAPLAFIVLPLVSAFFVDLANALVIGVFTAF
ncbi:sodium/glutamate symporter [Martelella alba]|uniref:Sodium/glutamate symporter n=1 Tax=Martelella alba TaxID=2590451 RepID=A0A506U135_9HYPH|nr:sodium/glutamate symporter [Martelella alba]TPW27480.1 sodium/glutamate symporter [Martelella alba]